MIRARAAAATLTLILTALPVAAQSDLERLETAAVIMNGMLNEAMIAEIPALDGLMPDPALDDSLRTAYTCMYDGYVSRVGEAPVSAMIDQMEASLETLTPEQLLQGGGAPDNPEGITDDQAIEIVTGCGLMEAFMTRMADSGAMGVLMQQQ